MVNCPECKLSITSEDEVWNEVICDGCHAFFHRSCGIQYRVISVLWDADPKAYAFCKECVDYDC